MKIFISHKREDEVIARGIRNKITQAQAEAYLDVIDDKLTLSGDNLAAYLHERLGECDSLLAVVSENTRYSMWVPWEIGIATEKNYPLSTFLLSPSTIPEFLNKWPVLRQLAHVDKYISRLRQLEWDTINREIMRSESKTDAKHKSVQEFHKDLKNILS